MVKSAPKPKGKPRGKTGPHGHVPTPESRHKVRAMAALGIPQLDIAAALGIEGVTTDNTLRRHYRRELDTALIEANAMVAGALYRKAVEGDLGAIVWWEKTRAGKSGMPRKDDDGGADVGLVINVVA